MSTGELVQATQGDDVMALGDRQDVQHKREGSIQDEPSKCRFSLNRQMLPFE